MSKELKVLELFSGIGSQHKALTNIGIKSICTQCDIDKYAIQAYNAIHGETENLGDISLIDESKFVRDQWDLVTYSSPCQDFSFAGLQAGGEKGSGTRSSLLWEVEKVINSVRPKYLLMENVKALVSKKFLPCFEKWVETLNSYGYKTYWKVLNAKDFGIPQNRERVFAVSIRDDINQEFVFPEGHKLQIRLKDVLETSVEPKYYLSQQVQDRFQFKPKGQDIVGTTAPDFRTIGQRDIVFGTEGTMGTLVATDYKQPKQIIEYENDEPMIGASRGRNPENPSDRTVGAPTEQRLEINSQGISNTLTSVQKDNWVVEPQIQVLGNYKPSGHECGRIMDVEGISPTIKENHGAVCAIAEPQERMTKQAFETLEENICKDGDVINPFNKRVVSDGTCPTITTRPEGFKTANLIVEEDLSPNRLFNIYGEDKGTGYAGNVWDKEGLSPTLTTMEGGNRQPMIIDEPQQERSYKIRKLTPRECYRLMGFSDEDFDKVKACGISDSQCYKQAGNSIVVNCLMAIFTNMFKDTEYMDSSENITFLEQTIMDVIENMERKRNEQQTNEEKQLDLVDWIQEQENKENDMTLDEAIEHANEVAMDLGDCDCGKEHKQLGEWLSELKDYKQEPKVVDKPIISKDFVDIESIDTNYYMPSKTFEEQVLEKLDRIIELLSQK